MTETKEQAAASNASKRLARLVAVQALYQASYGEDTLKDILKRCVDEAASILNAEEEGEQITGAPDPELLNAIVRGVQDQRETLDEMLAGAMGGKPASRMEILLRTILLAGAFELYHHAEIPQGIIISDYVDVTHAFFNTKEPGLVNAILDKLAQKLRS